MAFRAVARRWPAAAQMRASLQRRAYSTQPEYTGAALNEKEKAAENRFIRNMEEERRAAAVVKPSTAAAEILTPPGESPVKPLGATVTAESGFRNIAVVAGLVAFVSSYWLLSRSSKKEVKEEKEIT